MTLAEEVDDWSSGSLEPDSSFALPLLGYKDLKEIKQISSSDSEHSLLMTWGLCYLFDAGR